MFSRYERSVLHAFAEAVAPYRWWWGNAPNTKSRHDFGRRNLRNTPWLHRRADGDYNGWWMCLIPTRVIKELGLAIPIFIKWDDAEYGVRARDRGIPDGVAARGGLLAGAVDGQERRPGLERLLPPAQPDRGRAAALATSRTAASCCRRAWSGSCRPCCPCSTPRSRCALWPSRTCCAAPRTCTPRSAPSWPQLREFRLAVRRRPGRGRPGQLPPAPAAGPGGGEGVHHADQQAATC